MGRSTIQVHVILCTRNRNLFLITWSSVLSSCSALKRLCYSGHSFLALFTTWFRFQHLLGGRSSIQIHVVLCSHLLDLSFSLSLLLPISPSPPPLSWKFLTFHVKLPPWTVLIWSHIYQSSLFFLISRFFTNRTREIPSTGYWHRT